MFKSDIFKIISELILFFFRKFFLYSSIFSCKIKFDNFKYERVFLKLLKKSPSNFSSSGIILFLNWFLKYELEELEESSLHVRLFVVAYSIISFFSKSISGLLIFLFIEGIPTKPSSPDPLEILIKKVSKESLMWCAVNICFISSDFEISSKNSYLKSLAIIWIDFFECFLIFAVSNVFEKNLIEYFLHKVLTNFSSKSLSSALSL